MEISMVSTRNARRIKKEYKKEFKNDALQY